MSNFEFNGKKYKKSSFRNEVVNRMVERTIQPDGRCFETFRRINVFAKK